MANKKDQPYFHDLDTWYEALILKLERRVWFGKTDASIRSYICPLCHSVIVDKEEHYKWHYQPR